jgi:hypothetical protein
MTLQGYLNWWTVLHTCQVFVAFVAGIVLGATIAKGGI